MSVIRYLDFGQFRIDLPERALLRDGEPVQLTPKAFDTLLALVQNNGHTLTRDELMRIVWPDTVVEENNLTQNISFLRKVLGDSQKGARFIETVPKRGYRFGARVTERQEAQFRPEVLVAKQDRPAAATPNGELPSEHTLRQRAIRRGRWMGAAGLAAILALPAVAWVISHRRQSTGRVAGRIVHGVNPRAWVKELRAKLGEPVGYDCFCDLTDNLAGLRP